MLSSAQPVGAPSGRQSGKDRVPRGLGPQPSSCDFGLALYPDLQAQMMNQRLPTAKPSGCIPCKVLCALAPRPPNKGVSGEVTLGAQCQGRAA